METFVALAGCALMFPRYPMSAVFLSIVAMAKTLDEDPPSVRDPPTAILLLPAILLALIWAYKGSVKPIAIAMLVAYAGIATMAKSTDATWIAYLATFLTTYALHASPAIRLALMTFATGGVATRYVSEAWPVWKIYSAAMPLMMSFMV
jgi:hypothetical protein